MAEPLTHQPFMALNAQKLVKVPNNVTRIHPSVIVRRPSSKERAASEPDRQHVEDSAKLRPSSVPPPTEPPPESVSEPMTVKGAKVAGTKAAFVRAHPDVQADKLAEMAKKQGLKLSIGYIYTVRSLVKSEKKTGKKKRPYTRRTAKAVANEPKQRRSTRANGATNGSTQAIAIGEALTLVVRELVAIEVKRLLLQGVG